MFYFLIKSKFAFNDGKYFDSSLGLKQLNTTPEHKVLSLSGFSLIIGVEPRVLFFPRFDLAGSLQYYLQQQIWFVNNIKT